MLSEMTDNYLGQSEKKAERCRPDYEAQIRNMNDKLSKNKALFAALMEYLAGKRVKGSLAEMIGELVSEERQLSIAITHAIAQQETDSGK